ncbi:MAG: hypothetical protein P8X97_08380, partial [Candidatus Bathyarchaeota archaeon]
MDEKMKIGSKFVFIGIISFLIGSAFASPLLISELDPNNIKPYLKPPADSYSSNVTSEVLYANFSLNPNLENAQAFDLSYFVVLNITNNSDEPANITNVGFNAEVQDYTLPKENNGGSQKSEAWQIWTEKEAWVDGKHYNLTWIPN